MNSKEELIKEAIARGIKPGAVIKTPLGDIITVPEPQLWSMNEDGWLYVGDGFRCVLADGEWATVIVPAPEDQPQGLVDGMACEPDEHMRRAIVEKAKELGNKGPTEYKFKYLVWYKETMLWQSDGGKCYRIVSPGEFYDRLCKTVKPEPRISIGDYHVTFNKGSIYVGGITVSNDIVRKVAERLKD